MRIAPALLAALALGWAPAAAARETLVPSGATWRYFNEGEQAPSGWETLSYDDAGWLSGPAQLGFGEGDEGTTLDAGDLLTWRTAYFRYAFDAEDPTGATGLVLDLLADKGAVVYLNGVEVYRGNMQPVQRARYEAFAVATSDGWTPGIFIDPAHLRAGLNVLAVETHQDEPMADELSFDARLERVDADEAALLNGPWVTQLTSTSARILWETDAPTDTAVEWGTTAAYGATATSPSGGTLHSVLLTGLTPGTRYHYRAMGSQGALSPDGAFRTIPGAGRPFTWLVYGDSRSNPDRHAAVVGSALQSQPDLVVTTGDMVEAGDLWSQWHEQFFAPAAPLLRAAAILPVVGNHDSEVLHPGSRFPDYFPTTSTQPWYSVRYGDVELFVVDTSHAHGRASRQVKWLEDALASSTAPILVAAHHYPVFSSGKHGSDPFAVGALMPLYEQYGVAMVLNGHDHLYAHSYKDGVHYVLAGGGGAGLYDVDASVNPYQVVAEKTYSYAIVDYDGAGRITVTAQRSDGTLIETFTVTPEP